MKQSNRGMFFFKKKKKKMPMFHSVNDKVWAKTPVNATKTPMMPTARARARSALNDSECLLQKKKKEYFMVVRPLPNMTSPLQ